PRECFRLQGFPDWAFNRASRVTSNSQLYKQAGNAVTVPVAFEIGKRLAAIEKEGESE
ncbi:DNA cytosine methyltransferase, partial [Streptococcus suis]